MRFTDMKKPARKRAKGEYDLILSYVLFSLVWQKLLFHRFL